MKKQKLLTVFLFLLASTQTSLGQKNKEYETQLISDAATIEKFHTIDELNVLGKADLIKLYNERFRVVILLLPYSALSNQPGTTLEGLGIPVTSENQGLLKYENKTSKEFYTATEYSLQNFIAYADKNNIVWSIILFEDIIKKIKLGKDY